MKLLPKKGKNEEKQRKKDGIQQNYTERNCENEKKENKTNQKKKNLKKKIKKNTSTAL